MICNYCQYYYFTVQLNMNFSYQKKWLNLNLFTLKLKKWHLLNVFNVLRKFLRKIQSYYAQFESALEENDKTEMKNVKFRKKQNWKNFRFSLERENEFWYGLLFWFSPVQIQFNEGLWNFGKFKNLHDMLKFFILKALDKLIHFVVLNKTVWYVFVFKL